MRPICFASIGYILGIIWGLYFNMNIVFFFACLLLIGYVIKMILNRQIARYLKVFIKKKAVVIIIIFAVISNWQFFKVNEKYENTYVDIKLDSKYEGAIISDPIEKEYNFVYTLEIDNINGNKKYGKTKLFLYVKKQNNMETYEYGDYVQVFGEFVEPQEQRNYKGFNYKEYLKTKEIYGILRSSNIQVLEKESINLFYKIVVKMQNSFKENLKKVLPEQTRYLANRDFNWADRRNYRI